MGISEKKRPLILAIVFIVFVACAAWAYMSFSETIYEREQVLDYSYSYSGAHELTAFVSEENPVYEVGSDLTGMAGYYYVISPRSTIDFDFTFTSTLADTTATATATTFLVISEVDDDGIPFWSQEIEISSASESGTDSVLLHDDFVIDAQAYDLDIISIQEALGASPGRISGLLTTYVTLEGEAGSTPLETQERFDIPFTFNEEYYTAIVPDPSVPETKKFYTLRTVSRSKTVSDVYMELGAAVAALAVLVVLLFTLGKKEEDADASKFRDWISFGVYPSGEWDKEVYVPKLKDLVDIAIDSHKRVLFDTSKDVFFVIDGRVLYYVVQKKSAESTDHKEEAK